MRYPDNPRLIDAAFLKRLDAEEPGMWLAQPKYDGWRRLAWLKKGKTWEFQAKHSDGPAAKPMPVELMVDWTTFTDPLIGKADCCFDCEWMGPRGNHPDVLCLFDLLQWDGHWLGKTAFVDRYAALAKIYEDLLEAAPGIPTRIELVQTWSNPGLDIRFIQQMQDPRSEGLVIRRHNSGLVGNTKGATDNPYWFKIKYQPQNRVIEHLRKEGEA